MDYEEMIAREKRRRDLLVQKLDETERRIAMLTAMTAQQDPLDRWLDEQTAAMAGAAQPAPLFARPANDGPPNESSMKRTRETPKKITQQWVGLIEFLGLDGKNFSQVEGFMSRSGTPMTPGSIRTGLMNYRKAYALVSSPKPGYYIATQKGLDFVQAHRDGG